jgi:hypothetical protein
MCLCFGLFNLCCCSGFGIAGVCFCMLVVSMNVYMCVYSL